ncbi:DNA polymerase ligase (LigD) domain-containing protein [Sarocladium implicatum]|nr:DNA polymerase ligase (LigD) domain-containing protein [Sarocladium implicatum]
MSKRHQSPDLIPNPFVKKRNLTWTLNDLPSDAEERHRNGHSDHEAFRSEANGPPTADIEAGKVQITDHLGHFTSLLSSHALRNPVSSSSDQIPLLSVDDYASLYESNSDSRHGAHFVIHQHDHPIAGTHYDLRLQINETSSASWAIMYGLPGDPNSKRLNRNATETRVHCLWVSDALLQSPAHPFSAPRASSVNDADFVLQNHLVETASPSTGSLLIWDTGTYSILPRRSKYAPSLDPSSPTFSPSSSPSSSSSSLPQTQQQKLHAAFQSRKIRIRLYGSKLPDPYVLNLRLTKPEDAAGRLRSKRAPKFRRQRGGSINVSKTPETSSSSSSSSEDETQVLTGKAEDDATEDGNGIQDPQVTSAMERELRELEDAEVRATNAYPGARNSIGSVHQRRWYLSLDRAASGFAKKRGGARWEFTKNEKGNGDNASQGASTGETFDDREEKSGRLVWPFYVRGSQWERSVVTGRTGADVLRDEGVKGFIPRKGWTPVLN